MWVIGGYDGSEKYDDFEKYGGSEKKKKKKNDVWKSSDGITWTLVNASAGFSARYQHTAVVYDSAMWVIGGYDGSEKMMCGKVATALPGHWSTLSQVFLPGLSIPPWCLTVPCGSPAALTVLRGVGSPAIIIILYIMMYGKVATALPGHGSTTPPIFHPGINIQQWYMTAQCGSSASLAGQRRITAGVRAGGVSDSPTEACIPARRVPRFGRMPRVRLRVHLRVSRLSRAGGCLQSPPGNQSGRTSGCAPRPWR
ncbi:hypothetical protein CHS0354_030052 [Potamilus streckersoni]|uniref:Uncharacterized protein n=1 Tax=Potamilus streckersoni TaxID=2493646 RepID=A0AAE0RLS5_9BIVA|nr:hypothetical protein CHS0354_030052 [Potamilus streckersoni]